MNEEKTLVSRIVAGAREEFSVIVEAHEHAILNLIARQTGDLVTARELAQDTFIKAYTGLKTFKGESSLRTWLTRIALNVVKTHFTSNSKRLRLLSEIPKYENSQESLTEETHSLRKALRELPDKYREALVLVVLEGYTREEASEVLKIPAGTVASRASKALELLKRRLRS